MENNIEILNDLSDKIFEDAIKNGILSDIESDKNYAGYFMYMYSINNIHYFKHKMTRKYGYDYDTIMEACNLWYASRKKTIL
jgi:hypothetical protein